MRRFVAAIAFLGAAIVVASSERLSGQAPHRDGPQFEVASIKPADRSVPRPGRLMSVNVAMTLGRLAARNATLKDLVRNAYSLDDYQVLGGPAWMSSARFDVEAKAGASTNSEQLLLMLQSLLRERFKIAAHRETKELGVFALVLDKNGPKFHALEAAEQACYPSCADHAAPLNRLRQRDLPSLARYLTRLGADRPVVDRTGLTGTFRIELDMQGIMEAAAQISTPPTSESIYQASVDAVQDQLGLKLVPAKAPVDVLVIDHAEKPTPD